MDEKQMLFFPIQTFQNDESIVFRMSHPSRKINSVAMVANLKLILNTPAAANTQQHE